MSDNIFLPGPQKSSTILPDPLGSGFLSGLIAFIMHTASITSLTAPGGEVKPLTTPISFEVRVFKALMAASRAGKATAKSASQSSLMA